MLLIDDEPVRLARRLPAFERHGFEVCGVASPDEALATLRNAWVCDVIVIELRAGLGHAVATVNALRGIRTWLPAVIIGGDAPPPGVMLRDPGVRTVFVPQAKGTLPLSSAILSACCPGRLPEWCAFRRLIGPMPPPRRAPEAGHFDIAC